MKVTHPSVPETLEISDSDSFDHWNDDGGACAVPEAPPLVPRR